MADLASALRMALGMALLAALLWGLAHMAVSTPGVLQIYRPAIGNLPAHLFAERLAELQAAGDSGTVALVGPSTVREGFDPHEMERIAPGYSFINLGVTSQGAVHHTEMLLDSMSHFDLHPQVLALGLNSRILSARHNLLGKVGFVDLLDESDAFALLPWEPKLLWPGTLAKIEANRWWPLNRIASRLDAWFRFQLLRAHTAIFAKAARPEDAFRRGGNSLLTPNRYLYKETEHSPGALRQQLDGTRQRGLFAPEVYGGLEQIHGLHRVLDKAQRLSDQVYVIIMPEHSTIIDHFAGYADAVFEKTLDMYREAGVRVLDHRRSIADKRIRDMAHLVADGRVELSRLVAAELTTASSRGRTRPE